MRRVRGVMCVDEISEKIALLLEGAGHCIDALALRHVRPAI